MKPTIATIKSFIRKNEGNLLISHISHFDPMTDCTQSSEKTGFHAAIKTDDHLSNTFGIKGAWFVGRSRDYITPIGDDSFHGYHVYNSCGSFSLGVKTLITP